jgi:predicted DNA-binding transcriptional regulator AlpA
MRQNLRRVPTRENGVSDAEVITALGISKATFFRFLRSGILAPPVPLNGTKRRWWTAADLQFAKDALHLYRRGRTA